MSKFIVLQDHDVADADSWYVRAIYNKNLIGYVEINEDTEHDNFLLLVKDRNFNLIGVHSNVSARDACKFISHF